jgi:hypothetical protein
MTLDVETYYLTNPKWQEKAYEGRHPVTFSAKMIKSSVTYPAGSVVIVMNQRSAKVIAHLLEPQAPDALIGWGFMDAIFEQKEYGEAYVMEKIAREMLRDDKQLKKEFEEKIKNNPVYANNSWAMLNWFYNKSAWADASLNVYPVGRITDKATLEKVLQNLKKSNE